LRAERICSALRLLGELFCVFLFVRFCREMLLSGQMPPPNFAVLLYRTVYFRFSRGLIAILPSGLGFLRLLAADIPRKFGSIYPRAVSFAPF